MLLSPSTRDVTGMAAFTDGEKYKRIGGQQTPSIWEGPDLPRPAQSPSFQQLLMPSGLGAPAIRARVKSSGIASAYELASGLPPVMNTASSGLAMPEDAYMVCGTAGPRFGKAGPSGQAVSPHAGPMPRPAHRSHPVTRAKRARSLLERGTASFEKVRDTGNGSCSWTASTSDVHSQLHHGELTGVL